MSVPAEYCLTISWNSSVPLSTSTVPPSLSSVWSLLSPSCMKSVVHVPADLISIPLLTHWTLPKENVSTSKERVAANVECAVIFVKCVLPLTMNLPVLL